VYALCRCGQQARSLGCRCVCARQAGRAHGWTEHLSGCSTAHLHGVPVVFAQALSNSSHSNWLDLSSPSSIWSLSAGMGDAVLYMFCECSELWHSRTTPLSKAVPASCTHQTKPPGMGVHMSPTDQRQQQQLTSNHDGDHDGISLSSPTSEHQKHTLHNQSSA
jgi:hypothetical protein